jgi:hypothetical protein
MSAEVTFPTSIRLTKNLGGTALFRTVSGLSGHIQVFLASHHHSLIQIILRDLWKASSPGCDPMFIQSFRIFETPIPNIELKRPQPSNDRKRDKTKTKAKRIRFGSPLRDSIRNANWTDMEGNIPLRSSSGRCILDFKNPRFPDEGHPLECSSVDEDHT